MEAVERDARLTSAAWVPPPPPPPPDWATAAKSGRAEPPAPPPPAPHKGAAGANASRIVAAPAGEGGRIGSFADLQAKLDEMQGNIKKRSNAGEGFKPSSSRPLVVTASKRDRKVSSRGGLQWSGTRSYQESRRYGT